MKLFGFHRQSEGSYCVFRIAYPVQAIRNTQYSVYGAVDAGREDVFEDATTRIRAGALRTIRPSRRPRSTMR
jgi:hypothetical protein